MGWSETLKRLTGRAAATTPLPSADYYFLAGVGDLISPSGVPTPRQPIVQLGPNTWVHADRLVIIRYATARELANIEAMSWRSVHYVIDDLLPAAAASFELPPDYREKLQRFTANLLPRILGLAPTIVAPSQAILDGFPEHPHQLLDPVCLSVLEPLGLPPPTPWVGPIRIAFLGTRSHIGSMTLIDGLAQGLERACLDIRLHLFMGRHLPAPLAARRNIVNDRPLSWDEFRAFCRTSRFHVGLAPVQNTSFAQARSITKIMDHAAVGVYSRRPPFDSVIEHGRTGMFAADGPEAWTAAILDLASAPRHAAEIARAGAELAAQRGAPARVRRFWLKALGLSAWFAHSDKARSGI